MVIRPGQGLNLGLCQSLGLGLDQATVPWDCGGFTRPAAHTGQQWNDRRRDRGRGNRVWTVAPHRPRRGDGDRAGIGHRPDRPGHALRRLKGTGSSRRRDGSVNGRRLWHGGNRGLRPGNTRRWRNR